MAYEQKEGDIVVYKVKDKTNPKGPDFTGKALINGVEKQVSFWQKSDTMLAGQVKEKFKGKSESKAAPQSDESDEIPY